MVGPGRKQSGSKDISIDPRWIVKFSEEFKMIEVSKIFLTKEISSDENSS
jgi:hypothetical protein